MSEGDEVNLERCMRLGDRLDGHIVQGHVDQIGKVKEIEELDGSWKYTIEYNASLNNITVEKGSVTVNGTSLTVVDSGKGVFCLYYSIHLQLYNLQEFKEDDVVNIEFDVVGKYIAKLHRNY